MMTKEQKAVVDAAKTLANGPWSLRPPTDTVPNAMMNNLTALSFAVIHLESAENKESPNMMMSSCRWKENGRLNR